VRALAHLAGIPKADVHRRPPPDAIRKTPPSAIGIGRPAALVPSSASPTDALVRRSAYRHPVRV
jgi:hypothetical protein